MISKYNLLEIQREILLKLNNLKYLNSKNRVMDFLEANQYMLMGRNIRRMSWPKEHIIYDVYCMHRCTMEDLEAFDWQIC